MKQSKKVNDRRRRSRRKTDNVNSPAHYNAGGIEVIEAIEAWGLSEDFYLANAIKYVARSDKKGNQLEDILKAIWYLKRKVSRLEKISKKKKSKK